jgi:nitrogen regulatory protein PII
MKIISAIIRPQKLEPVTDALNKEHVVGMTVTDVRGFGRQKGQVEHYRGEPYTIRFVPKVKLELVIQDEDVSKIMETIIEAARTGQVGDGKIFVCDVPSAVRIRTGEKGTSAL